MINTGKNPKAVSGKPAKSKPTTRKVNKPKGDYDDMSAKPASKKAVDKAVKAGKARRAK